MSTIEIKNHTLVVAVSGIKDPQEERRVRFGFMAISGIYDCAVLKRAKSGSIVTFLITFDASVHRVPGKFDEIVKKL